jgi:hypothetical protein
MLPVWFLRSRSPDWFAGRGRPPQAAARRSGLEGVEKSLPSSSTARTRRSGTPACFASRSASGSRRINGSTVA